MSRLKIAYYTTVSLDSNDGPAINESEFIYELKKNYNDNFLFITDKKNQDFCLKNKLNSLILLPNFRLRFFFSYAYLCFRVTRKIFLWNPDVLVGRISDFPLLPLLYKMLYAKKKIAIKTAALWFLEQEKAFSFKGFFYKTLNNFIIKKVYEKSDVVDTALEYAKEALINKGIVKEEKIFLIDNAINTTKFSPEGERIAISNIQDYFPILGFMGSFPSQRGAKQALEVARRIQYLYPKVAVIILGSDPYLQDLIDSYATYNFPIHAPGTVDYSTIEKYVRLMTIGFSFYEPTVELCGNASQKVRQYLSCGKPVFSVHHNHEFLESNNLGSIFKSNEYELMGHKAITWLDEINSNSLAIERRIRKYALENLSCSFTFSQRLNIYQNILKK